MDSDRTPADVIAEWSAALPTMAYEMLSDNAVAISVLKALEIAGFRVTPIPDDNTRALASRLRKDAEYFQATAEQHQPPDSGYRWIAADLRAAAALLDGQPQDRPAQCPNCRSKHPDVYPPMFRHPPCGHAWHVGGSGDTR